MPRREKQIDATAATPVADLWPVLDFPAIPRTTVQFLPQAVIFAQGTPCATVMYIHHGAVKLSVVSRSGKQGIVAMLGAGDFLGEDALTTSGMRPDTATALLATTVLDVPKAHMLRLLREDPVFAHRFITYVIARNLRIEEDLVDQLFNSSEKRLARTLLLLARNVAHGRAQALPRLTQEVLAEIIGTTRSRVNFFMNKFRKLGLVDYPSIRSKDRGLRINIPQLNNFLHGKPAVGGEHPRLLPNVLNVLAWAYLMTAGGYLLAA